MFLFSFGVATETQLLNIYQHTTSFFSKRNTKHWWDVQEQLLLEHRKTVIFIITIHMACDYLCPNNLRLLLKMFPGPQGIIISVGRTLELAFCQVSTDDFLVPECEYHCSVASSSYQMTPQTQRATFRPPKTHTSASIPECLPSTSWGWIRQAQVAFCPKFPWLWDDIEPTVV